MPGIVSENEYLILWAFLATTLGIATFMAIIKRR